MWPTTSSSVGPNPVSAYVTGKLKFSNIERCVSETCSELLVGYLRCDLFGLKNKPPNVKLYTYPAQTLIVTSGTLEYQFIAQLPSMIFNYNKRFLIFDVLDVIFARVFTTDDLGVVTSKWSSNFIWSYF